LTHACQVHKEVFQKPDECLKLLVPGLLYTIQNNLQYVAAANLEPAVFQVVMHF
jgi:UDP-sugar transporter A1/2/3